MSVTTVPERWDASRDSKLTLSQMADAAGLDFLLPIARWIVMAVEHRSIRFAA